MRRHPKLCFLLLFCLLLNLAQPVFAEQETEDATVVTDGTEGNNVLILHNSDGSEYTRLTSSLNEFLLPTMAARDGYTFLGWSEENEGDTNPDYEVGETVTVSGTFHLYAVFYDRSKEADLNVSKLSSGYDLVIFVGDSRTHSMELALEREYGKNGVKNVAFVARNGTGLKWLKKTGIVRLRKLIRKALKKNKKAKIAVVFNHGVNDLKNSKTHTVNVSSVVASYSSYMKKIAKELKKSGCDLYYMSVNPINSGVHSTEQSRKCAQVRTFNSLLESALKGKYTFIDSYYYLMENGYSTGRILQNNQDDGVHYTIKTSKRIYAYCLKWLRKYGK